MCRELRRSICKKIDVFFLAEVTGSGASVRHIWVSADLVCFERLLFSNG
jgi:hypothetical protein